MRLLESRLLLQLVLSFVVYHGAASNATFEIDLLKYEALPNKCCDRYKWVKIGPAKCSECDPYFRICMKHMPGGPFNCVTTTRENNVHTTDLTHGNIQPNHLSLDINNLQGSLAIDVDIKDYDSTTKDDDIDHLFYTFTSIASTEKVTVMLNGTRVRLTVSLKVSCKPGYFGQACNIQCVKGATWDCSSTGAKICRNGFSGPDCGLKVSTTTIGPTQKTTVLTKASTDANHTTTPAPVSTEPKQKTTVSMSVLTNPTETSTGSTEVKGATKALTTLSIESKHTTTTYAPVSNQTYTTTTMLTEPIQKASEQMTAESSTPGSQRNASSTKDIEITGYSIRIQTMEAPNKGVHNITRFSLIGRNLSMPTTPPATHSNSAQKTKYRIPEPLEVYSCNLMIEGHKTGLHEPIEEILTSVLTRHGDSTELKTLQAYVMSSTFETTDNGVDVTDVSFIVQHNGAVLTAVEVSRQLYSPQNSHLLADHLHARNLKQHSSTATNSGKPKNNAKQWISDHLPFVIVLACVLLFCLVLFAAIVGRSISRRKLSSVPKKQSVPKSVKYNEDQTLQMFSNKIAFDTPFSLDNPLYDFSCDQLQPYDGSHV